MKVVVTSHYNIFIVFLEMFCIRYAEYCAYTLLMMQFLYVSYVFHFAWVQLIIFAAQNGIIFHSSTNYFFFGELL